MSERVIKFRAWHKLNKRMYRASGMSYSDSGGELRQVCVSTPAGKATWTLQCFPIAEIDLMQFTGFADRNGTEVYEGDVVRVEFPEHVNKAPVAGWIDWDSTEGTWRIQSHSWWCYLSQSDMEIIGNIHEHPELLEKEQPDGRAGNA